MSQYISFVKTWYEIVLCELSLLFSSKGVKNFRSLAENLARSLRFLRSKKHCGESALSFGSFSLGMQRKWTQPQMANYLKYDIWIKVCVCPILPNGSQMFNSSLIFTPLLLYRWEKNNTMSCRVFLKGIYRDMNVLR